MGSPQAYPSYTRLHKPYQQAKKTHQPNMSLFKRSNKNKSASAASTPSQTPRPSMQTIRDSGTKMTPEEALYKISQNMMTNASNGPFVR
ncbi:hypothetical protein BGW39_010386 [Mortierella sp. 14UC]|nr:hypothetical protein BGW39_010386 [Mortierella sp. 14UC]